MPFHCRKRITIFSSLGHLDLCLEENDLTEESYGVTISNPPYAFVVTTHECKPPSQRINIMFSPFHLCAYPIKQTTVSWYENGVYKSIRLG